MDSPNYARYTERQLRQVLMRIDVDRFPERVAEVHKQLAKFVEFRDQRPPSGAAGPRVSIWKSPTRTLKKIRVYLFLAAVICMLALIFHEYWWYWIQIAIVIGVGGLMVTSWDIRYIPEIYDLGEGFLVKELGTEIYVKLTQIHYVSAVTHDGGHYEVTLEMAFETAMGERINFFPTSDAVDAGGGKTYAKYLKQRIQAAKDSEGI